MTAPAAAATAVRERPILFSAPMVRAILAGQKTVTRRVVKLREFAAHGKPLPDRAFVERQSDGPRFDHPRAEYLHVPYEDGSVQRAHSPWGPGDNLWVKETWAARHEVDHLPPSNFPDGFRRRDRLHFLADGPLPPWAGKTRVSIHMPRWASRITLEVTEVRVERLHSISEEDARAEGVARERGRDVAPAMGGWDGEPWRDYLDREGWVTSARASFATLWRSINGPDSWAANPWVWCVSFRRVVT